MKVFRPQIGQITIHKLPYGMQIAEALGNMVGRRIKSVVNGAVVRLDAPELIHRSMLMNIYEREQTEWFRQCLAPGDTV